MATLLYDAHSTWDMTMARFFIPTETLPNYPASRTVDGGTKGLEQPNGDGNMFALVTVHFEITVDFSNVQWRSTI